MSKPKIGRGLDPGTGMIIGARGDEESVTYSHFRNAFVYLPKENQFMLEMTGIPFVELDNQLVAVGDEAIETAYATHQPVHRPMARGVISPDDTKAPVVLRTIFESVLGKPIQPNEPVFYSVPADPIDDTQIKNTYHTRLIADILRELGFTPTPINEATAICYAEAREDKFTALTLSFGAGMTNVAFTHRSLPVFSFSVTKGGDWIDGRSSAETGVPVQDITMLKEKGIDIHKQCLASGEEVDEQVQREINAICMHYRILVEEVVSSIKTYLTSSATHRLNSQDFPVILAGGTSLAVGFKELFEEIWTAQNLPLKIKEVRLAERPQYAVAKGCYFAAQVMRRA